MILDGHFHISDVGDPVWGWPPFTADDLLAVMDLEMPVLGRSRRIDWGAVMPALGTTTRFELSFREQHQNVIDAVRKYPDRLVGTFVLNPRLGVQAGVEELRRLVEEGSFRMVKLHPTMHQYQLKTADLVGPILEEAAALDIPVLIHMGEPPYSVPSLVEPVALSHPRVTIILAHLATQHISYAHDAINVARHCPNVMLETGWGSLPRLLEAVRAIGPNRLVFGSDTPPQEPFSQVRLVECLSWRPPLGGSLVSEDVERILGDNLASLLRLPR